MAIKDHMRKCIKDVCFVDVNQPNPLVSDELQQFDVVTATYLFEALKHSDMKYPMTNVANLLKPGGTLVIVGDVESSNYYDTNHELMLQGTPKTLQDFETGLAAAGLTIVHQEFHERDDDESDSKGTVVILAEKRDRLQQSK